MAKLFVIFLIAGVLVHAMARDIPNDQTNPSTTAGNDAIATTENVVPTGHAPAANVAVGDQKNFITYGGVGGWAGIGGFAGVIPLIPILGVGGVGGGSGGVGGLGGLGAGGLGGLGGGVGGAKGGAAGIVVP